MRRAFTLVELLISVVLLGIIVLFLSQSVAGLKSGIGSLQNQDRKSAVRDHVGDLIYRDFLQMEGDWNQSMGKEFDQVQFRSGNSLYGYERPYLVYLVLKNQNRLLRIESPRKHTPPYSPEEAYRYSVMEVARNIGAFRVFAPKEKGQGRLIYLELPEEKEPLIVEVLPLNTAG